MSIKYIDSYYVPDFTVSYIEYRDRTFVDLDDKTMDTIDKFLDDILPDNAIVLFDGPSYYIKDNIFGKFAMCMLMKVYKKINKEDK